jgi:hypothetical protein
MHLLTQLQRAVPQADAIGTSILATSPKALGDFVLCSHTLYYIPAEEWLAHLERLVSWMSSTGVTVVVLQNRGTACMTMLEHFFGHRSTSVSSPTPSAQNTATAMTSPQLSTLRM